MKKTAQIFTTLTAIVILMFTATARGQTVTGVTPTNSASMPADCSDNLLLEKTKNQWRKLDRLRTNTTVQSAQSTLMREVPAPYNWQWLFFQADYQGNWEIYRKRPTYGEHYNGYEKLTDDKAVDVRPKANFDGSKIVFVSTRAGSDDIFTMNNDGSQITRLTPNSSIETMPIWSPDSSRILYVSDRTGNGDIFLMDANGANDRALTNDGGDDLFPSWSPDGKQIAWVRKTGDERRLWVMNADGSSQHPITGNLRLLQNPAWSPNGVDIAFDYDSEDADAYNEVAVIAFDGSNFRKPSVSTSFYLDLWVTGWTPTGNAISVTYVNWSCFGGVPVVSYEIGTIGPNGTVTPERWDALPSSSFHDHKSLDIWPPVTIIKNLPPFSRSLTLNPSWSGYDIGPSGLVIVNFQVRTDENTNWLPWPEYTPRDKKLYFRSQGIDDAGNEEAWSNSATGDAQTEPFDWQINGHISDNRGSKLPDYAVTIFPPPVKATKTNIDGDFVSYRRGEPEFTFDETTIINTNGDASYVHYLESQQNLIRDGSFEEVPLQEWTFSTSQNIAAATAIRHHLNQSVRLGVACADICLNSIELPSATANSDDALGVWQILVDNANTIHLIGTDRNVRPLYQSRTQDGKWSKQKRLADSRVWASLIGILDTDGKLHVVWSMIDNSLSKIFHSYMLPNGEWSTPVSIGPGTYAQIALDHNGNLHVVYTLESSCSTVICPDTGIYHVKRGTNGTWGKSTKIWSPVRYGQLPTNFFIVSDRNGGIEVLLREYLNTNTLTTGIYGITIDNTDRVSSSQWLDLSSASLRNVALDRQGTPYLLSIDDNYLQSQLNLKTAQSSWNREPIWLSNHTADWIFFDQTGNLHVFGSYTNFYQIRKQNGDWSDVFSFPENNRIHAANIDSRGSMVIVQESYPRTVLRMSKTATETVNSSISQTVSIPANLHEPTLSFMYEFIGPEARQTFFEATISDGISTTQVFSTSQSTPWQLGWADMSPWANQTVTITFSLHQAQGDPIKALYLDQVSLGSWLTAAPRSADPAQFDVGKTPQIIINGENFIATPEVILGSTKLTNVQWLDENHISITPPSNLSAGIYDLYVKNPGASQSVLPAALKVGKQIYLPLIAR